MSCGRFYALVLQRWWIAFISLGLSFAVGSLLISNLLHTLSVNSDFLWMYGCDAAYHSGLRQFIELVIWSYVAAAFCVIFKICKKALVERVSINKRN